MFDLAQIVQPYTMATRERIELVIELCERANAAGISGDFVECGVWNGGLSAVLAHYAKRQERTVWLFDAFKGLPDCGPNDLPATNGHPAKAEVGKAVGDVRKVREIIDLVADSHGGYVNIYEGWFADTFPKVKIPQIAVLLLDSDWYSSELLCWQKFYDSVVPGGFVYVDDFFYWPGCARAAAEFFNDREDGPRIQRVGHSGWVQKGAR